MKLIILFVLMSTVIPALGETLTVDSSPVDVDIIVSNPKNGQSYSIGRTPLEIPIDQVVSSYVENGSFFLELRKEGFESQKVLLSKLSKSDIELKIALKVDQELRKLKKYDRLLSQVFEVQRLIRVKNYSQAIREVDSLTKDHPFFSTLFELKASALYLQRDFKSALSMYRKAFSINPENREAYLMKIYLEKKFGLKPVGDS